MSAGKPVPRLGELLVAEGALRQEQVGMLLDEQRACLAAGVHSRIGEIAVRHGWSEADRVSSALKAQAARQIDETDAGQVLADMGLLTADQLAQARRRCSRTAENVEEAVIEMRFAAPEQVRTAVTLAMVRASSAIRRITSSSFSPYNVMELVVGEETGAAVRRDGLCACSQCWSNVFALALNALPARYVSDHSRIPDYYRRFRDEYGELARDRVAAALSQVRSNPKASCLSRFSAEILSGREEDASVHEVTVKVLGRHVHLDPHALERLFGRGRSLTVLKELSQPGQFSANETVALEGPKGLLDSVRIVGPLRGQVQVEISGTDQFTLGISTPVRESGLLQGTPGITLIGPAGRVRVPQGVIRALRHLHLSPSDADRIGVTNGARVSVRLTGDRAAIAEGVLVRVSAGATLEMHIDSDEANAAGVAAESVGQVLIPRVVA